MTHVDRGKIETALIGFADPVTARNYVAMQAVKRWRSTAQELQLTICLPYPYAWYAEEIRHGISTVLSEVMGERRLNLTLQQRIEVAQTRVSPIDGVKNIIAVASAKGGVGKSTVAAHLALALQSAGARTGLLDADIYGPSQALLLETAQRQVQTAGQQQMLPVIAQGIQTMSIAYLLEEKTPVVWRAPMVTRALQQLLQQTQWDNLDYLIVDLPPGTGDIQLTLAQRAPLSGAVIVTTPERLAVLDARRSVEMFRKVMVPVLGVIGNMCFFTCADCGNQHALFGNADLDTLTQEDNLSLLARLPLQPFWRNPIAVSSSPPAEIKDMTMAVCHALMMRASIIMPQIVIEDD